LNGALAIRRTTDLAKLRELQARMPRALEILGVTGDPPRAIKLRIRIPTAKNESFPQEKQEVNEVEIVLPASYPLPPGPLVNFTTPIWNPNVYPSGKWCFGEWKITENLELFVTRLMKVIALDPTIINPRSAANGDAARWYVQLHDRRPDLFPTVSLAGLMAQAEKQKIAWRTIK
jgi:ubiquitin-protein ligase